MVKLLLLAVVLLGGCNYAKLSHRDLEAAYPASSAFGLPEVASASCRVLSPSGSSGSGVCFQAGRSYALVITANHVVDEGDEASISPENGTVHKALVVWRDAAEDLAVLRVPGRGVFGRAASMAARDLGYRWDPVLVYGFPAGVKPNGHPTFGLVAAEDDVLELHEPTPNGTFNHTRTVIKWRITAPIFFGNSGGGVFVSEGGEWRLAGVAQLVAGSGFGGVATHVGWSSPVFRTRTAVEAGRRAGEDHK